MCDGIMNQKLSLISELVKRERPEAMHEYIDEHLEWTLEELNARLDSLDR